MNDQEMVMNKVVAVTGAGRGIGRDIALLLARCGAKVVVNDIGASLSGSGLDSTSARNVVREIRERGGQAVENADSVANSAGARRIIETAVDEFGRIDGVVNNAGILRDRFFHKMSEEDWDAVIKVHLYGAYYISHSAAQYFRAQGSGAIVHVTSTSGLIGNLAQANYSAAKLGLVGLSKSIALDLNKFKVRSNCIAPFAWTRMIGSIQANSVEDSTRIEKIKQMSPTKIAPLVVYLLSDAAQDVTGQVFVVRNNEIFLMSQPRPIRSIHRGDGWTPARIAEHGMPGLRSSLVPLEISSDVFSWDPI